MEEEKAYMESGIYDYTEILDAIPYYDDLINIFLMYQIPKIDDMLDNIIESIRMSYIYKKMPTQEEKKYVLETTLENVMKNYNLYKQAFELSRKMGIDCCKLVEYIGHYPDRWPVPREEEKDLELEKLLEEYDIMPSYYAYDELDLMQITGNDINRISSTIDRSLQMCRTIFKQTKDFSGYFHELDDESFIKNVAKQISFPPSSYQMKGKSYREMRKKYLRLQGHKI